MGMFTETTRFRLASERAVAKVIDEDAIVIDTITGRYYSLEGPGETAWSMIVSSMTLGEAADAMRRRYETADADVLGDLIRLADQLVEENLIVEAPDEAASPPPPGIDGTGAVYSPPEVAVFRDMEDLLAFDPPLPAVDTSVWSGKRD